MGADAFAQGRHLLVLRGHPVAGQMIGRDVPERQIEHHAPGLAGAGQRLGQLLESRRAGALGGLAGDRRGGGLAGRVLGLEEMFRARNIRPVGGGQAAAGHQTASFSRAASAAISSRRQDASSRRLKPA